jgi:flagellar hook assembly protein FlgD
MVVRHSRQSVTALVVVLVVSLLAAPVGPATAQSGDDTTTVTVTVQTDDRTPVTAATVTASWEGGETSGDTAGNGKVFLDVPAGTTVAFAVDHPDFTRNFPLRRTVDADTDEVTVEVAPAVTFTYRVSDAEDEPVTDAAVTVLDDQGREVAADETDADGEFVTPQLEAGSYEVTMRKPGFRTVERTEDTSVGVTRQIEMTRGDVVLRVDVRDPRADVDVPGATVRVSGSTAETNADGRASLSIPVNTEVRVQVSREGYGDASRSVAVEESARTVEVGLARLPNLTVETVNRRVVVGESTVVRVTDAYGDPAANVTVLYDGEAVGTTGADGEVTVAVESAGEHEIGARRDRVTANTVTVEGVDEGDATTGTATSTAAVRTPGPSSGLAPGFGVGASLAALALLGLGYAVRSVSSRR